MAFLCPVRIRRGKKKKESNGKEVPRNVPSLGRITGSASIETLVRVGLEKEAGFGPDSKMVVLHDFTPCVDDELEVKRGHIVNVLYRENDWVYVIAENQQEGFIPHSYCAAYGSQLADLAMNNVKKKLPRDPTTAEGGGRAMDLDDVDQSISGPPCGNLECSDNDSFGGNKTSKRLSGGSRQQGPQMGAQTRASQMSLLSNTTATSQPDCHPFFKDPSGRYIVLYTFHARDENDVSVERGEFVTVLNREDPDWFWIIRSDGQEGFVPSAFVYPADVVQDHLGNNQNQTYASPSNSHGSHVPPPSDDIRYHGSELVMLYDYKAQAPDDLSVRRGDWIYADMNNQTVDGWLWAFAPKTRKYGFIPKAYARPPAMTSL